MIRCYGGCRGGLGCTYRLDPLYLNCEVDDRLAQQGAKVLDFSEPAVRRERPTPHFREPTETDGAQAAFFCFASVAYRIGGCPRSPK